MIWFLADLHGGRTADGLKKYQELCKKEDLLIVLGDVELNFDNSESNREFSEYFMSLDCNIAFVDGNHDNFDYLEALPVEDWNGGKVHRVTDRIVHLIRGHIFELEGSSFLVMGGCISAKQKWKDAGLWWEREQASDEELELAYENLRKRGNKVDYILTHKYSNPNHTYRYDSAEKFADYVDKNITFKHWYSGHWHEYIEIDGKHTVIYNEPKPLRSMHK